VLYFSDVPETGSYVFRVRVTRMGSGAGVMGAGVVEDSVVGGWEVGLDLGLGVLVGAEGSGGGLIVYFVVMRVCELVS
jgi:hypothetical protein